MILWLWCKWRVLQIRLALLDLWVGCCLAAAAATKRRHRRVAWCWCWLASVDLRTRERWAKALEAPPPRTVGRPHPVPTRLTGVFCADELGPRKRGRR